MLPDEYVKIIHENMTLITNAVHCHFLFLLNIPLNFEHSFKAHAFFQIKYQVKMIDKTGEMTTSHPLLAHLRAISLEPASSTLLTSDGGRLEVETNTSSSLLTCLLLTMRLLFIIFSYIRTFFLVIVSLFSQTTFRCNPTFSQFSVHS